MYSVLRVYHYFISDSVRHKMLYCYMYTESIFILYVTLSPRGPLIGTIKLLLLLLLLSYYYYYVNAVILLTRSPFYE